MSRRLEFLLKVTSTSADPFAWYGLAMEYRGLLRHDEAISTFEQLRARTPEYVPMYLMCGQVLESLGRVEEAKLLVRIGPRRGDCKRRRPCRSRASKRARDPELAPLS
jgi:predicted Zn-dependent protease